MLPLIVSAALGAVPCAFAIEGAGSLSRSGGLIETSEQLDFEGYSMLRHTRRYKPVTMHAVRSLIPAPEQRESKVYSPNVKIRRSSANPLESAALEERAPKHRNSAGRSEAKRQGVFSELIDDLQDTGAQEGDAAPDEQREEYGDSGEWSDGDYSETRDRSAREAGTEADGGPDGFFSELDAQRDLLNGDLPADRFERGASASDGLFIDGGRDVSRQGDSGLFGDSRTREMERLLDAAGNDDLNPLLGFSPALGIDALRPPGKDAPLGGLSSPYGSAGLGGGTQAGALDFQPLKASPVLRGFDSGLGRLPSDGSTGSSLLDDLVPSSRGSVQDMRPSRSILDGDD
ncbi:MAG: hypothetical protein O2923_05690 [Verrucomicrobia bacterium]|nr:hypothetical protein [Verrucomicrobiota bacterium]MDA1085843.1 hypothetical protein [Verrucomicrobiota bacterium]